MSKFALYREIGRHLLTSGTALLLLIIGVPSWVMAGSGSIVVPWTQCGLAGFDASGLWANGTNIIASGFTLGSPYVYLFLSTDKGNTWKLTDSIVIHNTNPRSFNIQIPWVSIIGDRGHIFVGIGDIDNDTGNVYLSTDHGESWNEQDSTFPRYINCFCATDSFLFVGTNNGVFSSTDQGRTWNASNAGLSSPTYDSTYGHAPQVVTMLAVDSELFAGTSGEGLYCSTNFGSNWRRLYGGLTDSSISGLAAIGPYLFAGPDLGGNTRSGGIFVSTDGGTSWEPDTGFTDYSAGVLLADGLNLYVGTSGGIYLSTDKGGTWSDITAGSHADSMGVEALEICDSELVASGNNGVWSCPLSEITSVHSQPTYHGPMSPRLEQNYPNPFNPSTTIAYDITKRSRVTLTLYDVLGKKIETLVDNEESPGHHEVLLDASRLSSGIYFYQIRAGTFVQTRKLVEIK